MKCIYTLFTKKGLKNNIGSYILISSIVYFCISSILFYKVGFTLLENDIKEIINEKEKNNELNRVGENKINLFKLAKKNTKKRKSKSKKGSFNNFPPKKRRNKSVKQISNSSKLNDNISQTKLKLKDIKILLNFQQRKSTKIKSSKRKKSLEKPQVIQTSFFTDYEINSFTYKEALIYDKRTYFEYYFSLIRTKHPIIFAFVPVKDYNTIIIKLCLFLLTFCIYYSVNRIFFTEGTIHKIYEDGGAYNLSYLLPKIILSFIIAHILSTILRYAFLSERNVIEIKNEIILDKARDKVSGVKRNLTIKYIIFFVSGILFLVFFWYYLSSFGAVYQNSQIYLIKNTFISYLIGLVYPFIINIFPGIFRLISLNDVNKNGEALYKISKFCQIL